MNLKYSPLSCLSESYLPVTRSAVFIDGIALLSCQNIERVMASRTIDGGGEDLYFHSKGVDSHDRRYNEKAKRNQEKVRYRYEYTQGGSPKALQRHQPCPFNTTLLAEFLYLHGTVSCRFVTCGDYLSGVLGGVMHGSLCSISLEGALDAIISQRRLRLDLHRARQKTVQEIVLQLLPHEVSLSSFRGSGMIALAWGFMCELPS
jgi:hypothetical protein